MAEPNVSFANQNDDRAGCRYWVICPDCGQRVLTAERPWWKTTCLCGKDWAVRVEAVGVKARPIDTSAQK